MTKRKIIVMAVLIVLASVVSVLSWRDANPTCLQIADRADDPNIRIRAREACRALRAPETSETIDTLVGWIYQCSLYPTPGTQERSCAELAADSGWLPGVQFTGDARKDSLALGSLFCYREGIRNGLSPDSLLKVCELIWWDTRHAR